jgi:hypothetical protein
MNAMITWPAPAQETASPDYTVELNGRPVFVYSARVRCEILQNKGLWTHKPDCPAEQAAFAMFDIRAPVKVVIKPARQFKTALVLPHRAGIRPEVKDSAIRFTLDKPRHLTVALDDSNLRIEAKQC